MIISATFLFMLGMAFCYFFVFGQVFHFIASFAPKSITPAPDIEAYLSFVMTMFLAFGLSFEVPVALVVMVKLGVVSVAKLREWRSYFIVGAFVVAAVVTPPDVVSQLALAIPMCLLYELGIVAASLVSKGTTRAEADAAAAAAAAAVNATESAKTDSDLQQASDSSLDLDAELDKAEADFRKLDGR